MTHLGNRVSALLDGQLGPEEEERAWAHVHGCHACRDLVEREGWVKTRLRGLSIDSTNDIGAPLDLKGTLIDPVSCAGGLEAGAPRPRSYGMLALGGGAVGAAVVGVLALTVVASPGPVSERRAPVTSVSTPQTRLPATVSLGAVTAVRTSDRLGPHQGEAGVTGVRMVP